MKKEISKFRAINLACGGKLCDEIGWINADHQPNNSKVQKVNLLKKFPFPDDSFDVLYHSQFIEHIDFEMGIKFTHECLRILKPGGIIRIVTPDLEDQANEYLNALKNISNNPNSESAQLEYEWIRLEFLEQLMRNEDGGDMLKFLESKGHKALSYIEKRLGRSGRHIVPELEENK